MERVVRDVLQGVLEVIVLVRSFFFRMAHTLPVIALVIIVLLHLLILCVVCVMSVSWVFLLIRKII